MARRPNADLRTARGRRQRGFQHLGRPRGRRRTSRALHRGLVVDGGRARGRGVRAWATAPWRSTGTRCASPAPTRCSSRSAGETKLDLVNHYLAVARAADAHDGRAADAHAAVPRRRDGLVVLPEARARQARPTGCETTIVSTPNGTTSRALVAADLAHVVWAVNLGCLGFHVWPYLADDPEHTDELRIDLDPQPGTDFTDVRAAAARGARAARRARHRRLPEDDGQPRHPRVRAARAALGLLPGARRPRSPSPASSSGAGPTSSPRRGGRKSAASASSSTSTRTRRTRRCSARGRCGPGPAARCRRRCAGTRSTTIHPDELTIADRAGRVSRRSATRGRR